jgi:hypothetical protein
VIGLLPPDGDGTVEKLGEEGVERGGREPGAQAERAGSDGLDQPGFREQAGLGRSMGRLARASAPSIMLTALVMP